MGTETETETTTDRMKAHAPRATNKVARGETPERGFLTIPLISHRVYSTSTVIPCGNAYFPPLSSISKWQAAPRDRNCVCSMLHVDLAGRVSQSCRDAGHALLPVCQFPGVDWNKHHTLGAVRPVGAGPKTWY